MQILTVALTISAVQLLFFGVCGLGVARLVLPRRLHAHTLTLAPLAGLSLLAIVGYYGANGGLSMRQLVPFVLVLSLVLLVWGSVRARREGDGWLPSVLPLRELLPLLLVLLATWVLNIAPVLSYGTLLPIGDNWDVEFYLPLADYLKDYSYPTLEYAPPNPLRDLLLTERVSSRAMGATYAQSMADLLLFRDAWDTWVPVLALLRALTLAGLYALLREGLGVRPAGALAGVALAGLNSLLLWTTYNSFGMGLGGLALLPAALVCTLVAMEEHEPRAIAAAALFTGGLTCTYWPMLMAYGTAGLGIGVALLWEHRHQGEWRLVALRGGVVLSASAAVGVLAHMRAPAAFLGVFALQTPSMGITSFVSPAVIAGSAPFSHRVAGLDAATTFDLVLAWGGLIAGVLLLAAGAWRGAARRTVAVGMVVCLLLYLAGLRWVVGFPYGYIRGASYVNTLLLGMVGAALSLSPETPRWFWRVPRSVPHLLHIALFAVVLASGVFASYATYRVYAERPGVYSLETASVRAAAGGLSQPGPVLLSPDPTLRGPYTGVWAYALRERELLGIMATGYQPLVNMRPGAAPAYGVLHRNDDPREYGMGLGTGTIAPLWRDERAALYAAPPARLAWLSGRATSYTEGGLLLNDTTYTRAQIGVGDYLAARPGMPLELYASSDDVFVIDVPTDAPPAPRTLTLALASYTPQTVTLDLGGDERDIALPAGASVYHTGAVDTPLRVMLHSHDETAPVFLRWISLEGVTEAPETPALHTFDDTMLVGIETTPQPSGADVVLQLANPGGERVRLSVELYEEVEGYQVEPAHDAWALFAAPPDGTHNLHLDLHTPAMTLDGEPLAVQTGGEPRDGHYFAALWVYQGEQVRRVLPFLRYERQGGEIVQVEPLAFNVAFVRLPPPANQLVDAHFGDAATLRGYERDAEQVAPGGMLRVSLLWQAGQHHTPEPLMVFVQVLDGADRKVAQWDGAAGGDWCPTPIWDVGQQVWQDVPLTIAPDTPPGRYRIIAGLFNPATGERLRMPDGAEAVGLGEVVVVEP